VSRFKPQSFTKPAKQVPLPTSPGQNPILEAATYFGEQADQRADGLKWDINEEVPVHPDAYLHLHVARWAVDSVQELTEVEKSELTRLVGQLGVEYINGAITLLVHCFDPLLINLRRTMQKTSLAFKLEHWTSLRLACMAISAYRQRQAPGGKKKAK